MKSTFDKNAEKFVNLMVEKIESLSMNWQKPWFSKVNSKQNFLPQNLTGRTYSGGNAFLLYFLCEKYNYQTPVFLTFNQARNEGINVLKGAVAFPVYYTLFCAYHRQTNEKISYDEYNKLSEEEQEEIKDSDELTKVEEQQAIAQFMAFGQLVEAMNNKRKENGN